MVSKDVGVPLHEYTHHLQCAMPELDALFAQLHRRRTASEPRVVVGAGRRELGREDSYIRRYQGREYRPEQVPLEVFTMAIQQLFYPVHRTEHLVDMIRKDSEMLDLILGVLLHYDP